MAKITDLNGKLRGKIGGVVYRNDSEVGTVASAYQPAPRNPRTILQTEQRGKMNMAGLFSKLTPYAAIAGFSPNKRKARSEFVSKLIRVTSATAVESVGGGYNYLAAAASVKFSKGLGALQQYQVSKAEGVVTAVVNVIEGVAEVIGVRFIACRFANNVLETVIVKDTNVRDAGGTFTASFDFSNGEASSNDRVNVYAIPIINKNTDVRVLYADYISKGGTNADYATAVNRSLSSLQAFGDSLFAGGTTII